MSMHLCGPALTTTGKKKGKVKFRNAAEAQRARQLDAEWKDLLKRQGVEQEERKRKRALSAEPLVYKLDIPAGRSTAHIKSLGQATGVAALKPVQMYTGDEMLGISQMAKSNAVPVFNSDHIVDIARMRR
jgi:hypothetical protein